MFYAKQAFSGRFGFWAVLFALLATLGACKRGEVVGQNPDGVLAFDVCPEALSTLPDRGGYQGLDGWFYFNHDLWEAYPNLQETEFIVQMNDALATQGVALVLVPLPGVGMSNPEFLHRDDPWQKAFSPTQAQADYRAYVRTLREQGVEVVDALATIQAYSAAGGQTFFKRDVHWTPEGANAVAQEIAESVRRAATVELPKRAFALTHTLPDASFYGKHINTWTKDYCGYRLPPEPLRTYAITPFHEGETAAVVRAGSSFSVPPFDIGFLAVALQSSVFNASIGGGGAIFPLETYLRNDLYNTRRPNVIVWEFPVSVQAIIEPQKRRILAAVYGACGDDARFRKTYAVEGDAPISTDLVSVTSSEHYLSFLFSDLEIIQFDVTLRYDDLKAETFSINHPETKTGVNQGRFFTTPQDTSAVLESITLEPPTTATGEVTVQVCRKPSAP